MAAKCTGVDVVEKEGEDGLLKRGRDNLAMPQVEIEHVKNVYNSIAGHWHGTRYKAWPRVEAFIREFPAGTLFGDLGCGNGKNLPACTLQGGIGIGCDLSIELVKIAMERNLESVVGDIIQVPFRDGCFDATICIAVLHHISTYSRRVQAIRECMRVIKVGGRGLFYAWAMEQTAESLPEDKRNTESKAISGHRFDQSDVLVPWHLKIDEKNPEFEASHVQVDTEKNAYVFQRYCHVYKAGELEEIFKELDAWVEVEKVYWDCGNWAVIAKKVCSEPTPNKKLCT